MQSLLPRLRQLTDRMLDEEIMVATFSHLCPCLICVLDSDLHFIHVSDAWEKRLNWKQDDLASEHLMVFIHPSDSIEVGSILHSLNRSEKTTFHARFKAADGSYVCLEWNVILTDDGHIYALATIIPQECFGCLRAQKLQ